MSLIDYVLNHELIKTLSENLTEEEREKSEIQIKEMLENIDGLYLYMQDILNTEDGVKGLEEALDYAISKEGQEEWQEKL